MDSQSIHRIDSTSRADARPLQERRPMSSRDTRRRPGNRVVADLTISQARAPPQAAKAHRVPPRPLGERSDDGVCTITQMLQRIYHALLCAAQYPGTHLASWFPACQGINPSWPNLNKKPLHNSKRADKLLNTIVNAAHQADLILGAINSQPSPPAEYLIHVHVTLDFKTA